MRRAERPTDHEPVGVDAGDAVNSRDLDRLRAGHRREDRRQATGEHRLACPGRALEQQVVAPGGGDLERKQRGCLSADIRQVGAGGIVRRPHRPRRQLRDRLAAHDPRRLAQRPNPGHLKPVDERRLARPLARDDQPREAGPPRPLGDAQRARRVPQLAAERELAEHRVGAEPLAVDLPARGEHGERERGVEPGPDLAQERGSEVGRDPRLRELEPGVEDRRADPVARLTHGGVAEPHDRERRQARADVDLDPYLTRVDAVDRERGQAGEHARDATPDRVTRGTRRVPILRKGAPANRLRIGAARDPRVAFCGVACR